MNLSSHDSNGYFGNFTFTERGYYCATQISGTCRLTSKLEKVYLSFFVHHVADTVFFEGNWIKSSKATSNVMYGILKDPQKKVFFGGTWMLIKA
jgi:alkyl hydroperoxide reductase subunit AhpC